MKKNYETPVVEKVEFQYEEQVVASPVKCKDVWIHTGDNSCTDGNAHWEHLS